MFVFIGENLYIEVIFNCLCFRCVPKLNKHKVMIIFDIGIGFENIKEHIENLILWEIGIGEILKNVACLLC